jgi:hypothetical protein
MLRKMARGVWFDCDLCGRHGPAAGRASLERGEEAASELRLCHRCYGRLERFCRWIAGGQRTAAPLVVELGKGSD